MEVEIPTTKQPEETTEDPFTLEFNNTLAEIGREIDTRLAELKEEGDTMSGPNDPKE